MSQQNLHLLLRLADLELVFHLPLRHFSDSQTCWWTNIPWGTEYSNSYCWGQQLSIEGVTKIWGQQLLAGFVKEEVKKSKKGVTNYTRGQQLVMEGLKVGLRKGSGKRVNLILQDLFLKHCSIDWTVCCNYGRALECSFNSLDYNMSCNINCTLNCTIYSIAPLIMLVT